MAPSQFRKSLCVAAGCITLIEAVIWEVVAVYSIGVYSCNWNLFGVEPGVSTWNLLYISYLMGGCKSTADAQSLGFNMTPPTDPARNFQVWMWIYAVFSAVFIPAGILFIIAATCEVRGSTGALLYYPWVCLTVSFLLLDLAGAIYHLVDVFNTTTQDNFAQFVTNTDWASLTSGSSEAIISWLPSLYIVLLFCRIIVIWLLNLFFVHGVYKASIAVASYPKHNQPVSEKIYSWRDMFYKGPDPELVTRPSTTTPPEGNRSGALTREIQRENMVEQFEIPPVEISTPRTKEAAYHQREADNTQGPYTPTGRSKQFSRVETTSPHRKETPPPLSSGSKISVELNKFEPFSYIAGDQPQLMRRPVSRSASHREYPRIPERDYTVADRRSLEYVPNRFRVPSPKRAKSQQVESPQLYSRSSHNNSGIGPQPSYIPQSAFTSQVTTQNDNYNINKLY